MSQLLAVGVEWIVGFLGIVAVVFAAWSSGKSKGTTEAQAKADVKEANAEAQQSQAVTEKQTETIKVVKRVEQTNQSMSDGAARDSMRGSKYHAKD